jgi:hypothetical protein
MNEEPAQKWKLKSEWESGTNTMEYMHEFLLRLLLHSYFEIICRVSVLKLNISACPKNYC